MAEQRLLRGGGKFGATLALLPHGLILSWMSFAAARADRADRPYAAYLAFPDLMVLQLGLLAAVVVGVATQRRRLTLGIGGGTLAGAGIVLTTALLIGNA